jgi:hypothetical protein
MLLQTGVSARRCPTSDKDQGRGIPPNASPTARRRRLYRSMRRVTDSDQVLAIARIKEAAATDAVSLQTYRPVHQSSASVMGLRASSPSSEYRVAGFMLPSVVDTRPPHHAVKERPAGQSKKRGAPRRASTALLPASLVPASRRRDLAGQGRTCRPVLPETQCALMSSYAATGASLPQRNSVPSIHMRWSTLPSLRASATFARFRPRRLATSIAQRLSVEKRVGRLSTALAAS